MPIVLNQAKREVLIYDDIGWDVTARGIVKELQAFEGEDITVRINSPGGSVFDGLAIYNALKGYEGNVEVMIDGIALSMASGIAMAGDSVEMAENALLMIHDPSAMAIGGADDMERAAKMLRATKEALTTAYVERTGLTTEEVSDLMAAETWFTAAEAKEQGFVDRVGEELKIAASFTMPDSLKVPADKVGPLNAVLFPKVSEPEEPMATDKKEPVKDEGPKPATLEQLLALNGADNDFAVEQLKNGSTLEQAQNCLNSILIERLEEANNAKAEAEKQAADALAEKPKASGHDPVANDGADDDGFGDNPKATFDKLLREQIENGQSPSKAYVKVHRNNPGLVDAVRAAATN